MYSIKFILNHVMVSMLIIADNLLGYQFTILVYTFHCFKRPLTSRDTPDTDFAGHLAILRKPVCPVKNSRLSERYYYKRFYFCLDHFIVLHNEQKYVDVFQDQAVLMVSVENLFLANPDRYPAISFNTRYPTGYRK